MRDIYNSIDPKNVIYQHHPTIYHHYIFLIWFILSSVLTYVMITKGTLVCWDANHYFLAILSMFVLILNYVYFFIAVQGICYVIVYEHIKRIQADTERYLLNLPKPTNHQWSKLLRTNHSTPKVALIYCTYNDFLPDCLYQCLEHQHYPVNVKILDDSNEPKYQQAVNQFAKLHHNHVQVIRRKKHSWDKNKAGNLNHGLKAIKNQHYDFFVFLDSDELLEPNFVHKMLKEFYYGDKYGYHIGLIQATHYSGRNTNLFMHIGSRSAKYFWNVQNVVRSAESGVRNPYGKDTTISGATVMSNLGHGCMASTHAIYQSKLFPNLVSEDVANTMSMLHHGWNVYFSTQIHGNEETVVSMNAMRTRSAKFAAGDLQWLKYYWKTILKSSILSTPQKFDAYLLMGMTDISSFLYITVPICSVIFPIFHCPVGTSYIFLIPCLVLMYAESIIDTCFSIADHMPPLKVLIREILIIAMYSSTYYLGVKIVFEATLLNHKAKFNVTPKSSKRVSVWNALSNNLPEMIFSGITIFYVLYFSGLSGWMILLAFIPPLLAPITELSKNKQSKSDKQIERIFHRHQKEALKYGHIFNDKYWDNWKV